MQTPSKTIARQRIWIWKKKTIISRHPACSGACIRNKITTINREMGVTYFGWTLGAAGTGGAIFIKWRWLHWPRPLPHSSCTPPRNLVRKSNTDARVPFRVLGSLPASGPRVRYDTGMSGAIHAAIIRRYNRCHRIPIPKRGILLLFPCWDPRITGGSERKPGTNLRVPSRG